MNIGYKTFKQSCIVFPDLEVIEGTPRLYVTPNGNYPSTTSVLSVFQKHDKGLKQWRDRVGEAEADKITGDASNRGNALHHYAELYLKNQLDHSMMQGDAKILFNRAKQYYEPVDLVVGTEIALYSDTMKFAGRPDLISVYDGKSTVLDHKNSRQAFDVRKQWARRKIFKYMLQCTGYAICFEELYNIKIEQGVLVIANYLKGNAHSIKFDISQKLKDELTIVVDAYYNDTDIRKTSEYFKL